MDIKDPNYWEELFVAREDVTPSFLGPVVNVVMVTGKSLHLMESISSIKKSWNTVSKVGMVNERSSPCKLGTTANTVYHDFLKNLLQCFSTNNPDAGISETLSHDTSHDHMPNGLASHDAVNDQGKNEFEPRLPSL